MDDLKDFFIILVIPIVFVLATLGLSIGGITYLSNKSECTNYQKLTRSEIFFSLTTGCLVKQDGQWLSLQTVESNSQTVKVK